MKPINPKIHYQRIFSTAALAIAAGVFLCSIAAANNSQEGTIAGTVYSANPPGVLSGITITFKPDIYEWGAHDYVVKTNGQGHYESTNMQAFIVIGSTRWIKYKAYISEESKGFLPYASEDLTLEFNCGPFNSLEHNISLDLANPVWSGSGSIGGYVRDLNTGGPLANATVTLKPHAYGYGTHDYTVTTDSQGFYQALSVIRYIQTSGGATTWIRYRAYVNKTGYVSYVSGEISFYPAMFNMTADASLNSNAITIRVPQDYPTVQQAIDEANYGDTVLLAAGAYESFQRSEPGFITLKSGVKLRGANGMASTIINAGIIAADDTEISGLTIFGVKCSDVSGVVIKRNRILGYCVDYYNLDTRTMGIEQSNCQNMLIENNLMPIHSVGHYHNPGGIYPIYPSIATEEAAGWIIKNNTLHLVGGYYQVYSIIETGFSSSAANRNNIVLKVCAEDLHLPALVLYGTIDEHYNLYNGIENGPVEIQAQFVSFDAVDYHLTNNYHLAPSSALIDAGDPADDYSLEPVPNGGRINIGAYGNTEEATCSPITIINVPADYPAIQDAINAANNGDTVQVAAGIYEGDLDICKAITLRSASGNPDDVIINGTSAASGISPAISVRDIRGSGREVKIEGLTIRNGGHVNGTPSTVGGGGVCVKNVDKITILNNVLKDNYIGIYAWLVEDISIVDNKIQNNGPGGGICLDTDVRHYVISGNDIRHNNANYFGAGIWLHEQFNTASSTGTVSNNVVVDNTGATEGVGIRFCTSGGVPVNKVDIINNTVAYNTGYGDLFCGGAGLDISIGDVKLRNNIIFGNRGIEGGVLEQNLAMVIDFGKITYNDIEGLAGEYGTGSEYGNNMDADPVFADTASTPKNVHLQPVSPCIDAGDPADDYSIEPEPNGNRINIGAYGNTEEAAARVPVILSVAYNTSHDFLSDLKLDDLDVVWKAASNAAAYKVVIYFVGAGDSLTDEFIIPNDQIVNLGDGSLKFLWIDYATNHPRPIPYSISAIRMGAIEDGVAGGLSAKADLPVYPSAIYGQVGDDKGAPLSEAKVHIIKHVYSQYGWSEVDYGNHYTDSDGMYYITGIPDNRDTASGGMGYYQLDMTKEGYTDSLDNRVVLNFDHSAHLYIVRKDATLNYIPVIINVPGDYPAIQQAIDAAQAGDTVQVAAGEYTENLVSKSGVNLIGAGMKVTTIDGVVEMQNQMELSGFTVNGIDCVDVSNVIIRRNHITGYPVNSQPTQHVRCLWRDATAASSNVLIENNIFTASLNKTGYGHGQYPIEVHGIETRAGTDEYYSGWQVKNNTMRFELNRMDMPHSGDKIDAGFESTAVNRNNAVLSIFTRPPQGGHDNDMGHIDDNFNFFNGSGTISATEQFYAQEETNLSENNIGGTSIADNAAVIRPGNGVIYAVWRLNVPPAVYFRRSLDNGTTWEEKIQLTPHAYGDEPDPSFVPRVCADKNGAIYVMWAHKWTRDLYLSRSFDYGATWAAPLSLGNADEMKEPAVACDNNDALYLAYKIKVVVGSGQNDEFYVVAKRSVDKGVSWEYESRLNQATPQYDEPFGTQISADDSGSVLVLWTKDTWNPRATSRILYSSTSLDYGRSWQAEETHNIGGPSTADNAQIIRPGSGIIYIVWRLSVPPAVYFRRSIDNGATWQEEVRLTPYAYGDEPDPSFVPRVCADKNGAIYVLWAHKWTNKLLLSRSFDYGATWEAPIDIGLKTEKMEPAIACDNSGRLYLTYKIKVDMPDGVNDEFFVVAERSDDYGISWQDRAYLNQATLQSDEPFEIQVSADDSGSVLVLWTKDIWNSNGTMRIIYSNTSLNFGKSWQGPYYYLLPDSVLVNAGDPDDDYLLEPEPNGGRIDIGAYGNTEEAPIPYVFSGTVQGRITDPQTLLSIKNAKAMLDMYPEGGIWPTYDYEAKADSNGNYKLSKVARYAKSKDGTVTWIPFTIIASKEGGPDYTSAVLSFADGVSEITHDVALPFHDYYRLGTLLEHVKDSQTGAPVAGATIVLEENNFWSGWKAIKTVTTDTSGDYAFEDINRWYNVSSGGARWYPPYRLRITAEGYEDHLSAEFRFVDPAIYIIREDGIVRTPRTINIPGDYTTIQEGVNAAEAGDVIRVAAGAYAENIALQEGVDLIGAGRGMTTINGSLKPADNTAIEGMTFKPQGARNALDIRDSADVTVRNCEFESSTGVLYLAEISGSNITLADNIFKTLSASYGISVGTLDGQSSDITITGNTIRLESPYMVCVKFVNTTGITMTNNVIQGSNGSVFLYGAAFADTCNDVTVKNNTIYLTKNLKGLFGALKGIQLDKVLTADIANNIIDVSKGPMGTNTTGVYLNGYGDISDPLAVRISYNLYNGKEPFVARYMSNITITEDNNTTGEPYFTDVKANNFHVLPYSPAVDGGDPADDYSLEPEPNGGRIDIGAYGNTTEAAQTPDNLLVVPDDYPTIQEAVNNSASGDIIYVRRGTYNESVTIDGKTLTIAGQSRYNTILDAQGLRQGLLIRNDTDVTILNMTIRNALYYNISISPASFYTTNILHLKGVTLTGSNYGLSGMLTNGKVGDLRASYVTIEDSNVTNASQCGISLSFDAPALWMKDIIAPPSGYDLSVSNSDIVYNGKGIAVSGSRKQVSVTHSVVAYNNSEGIRLYNNANESNALKSYAEYNIIAFNKGSGIWIGPTGRITLGDNTIYANAKPDIYVYSLKGLSPSVMYKVYGDRAATIINSDPLFTNVAASDFSVKSGSPALTVNTPALHEDCGLLR